MLFRHGADSEELSLCYAQALRHTEGPDSATQYLEETRKHAPHSLLLQLGLAVLYAEKQDFVRALDQYKEVLGNCAVADEHVLFNVGYCYGRIQDTTKAEVYYRRCLALNPHNEAARLNLANLLVATGRTQEAREPAKGISHTCFVIDRLEDPDSNVLTEGSRQPTRDTKGGKEPTRELSAELQLLDTPLLRLNESVSLSKTGDPRCEQSLEPLRRLPRNQSKLAFICSFYVALMSRGRQALEYYLAACESKWCPPLYRRFSRAQITALRESGLPGRLTRKGARPDKADLRI